MTMLTYDHLVHVDVDKRRLEIHRIYSDGSRSLFTYVELPVVKGEIQALKPFATLLGENLLLDSPGARNLLGL